MPQSVGTFLVDGAVAGRLAAGRDARAVRGVTVAAQVDAEAVRLAEFFG